MVKIVNLENTIRGFTRLLYKRFKMTGLESTRVINLKMKDSNQDVTIRFGADQVEFVPRQNAEVQLALSDLQMVQLLFLPGSAGNLFPLPEKAEFLRLVLPMDFYIWSLERA